MVVYRKDLPDLDTELGTTATQITEANSNEVEKTPCPSPCMVPRAILISRPNSHPFQDRHLILDQPVKVGRSVARCRPSPNNAIFDCKVLSRNHALLWYENGKFFLQDTKSSNGTFVNNQRLSKGSEESLARETSSGDIVQFGVDVVENSRKVTHGCIVVTLKLFLPDGKEAKASPTTAVVPTTPGTTISMQDLYQLSQYLQEAIHREQILETKLCTLQRVVTSSQEASDNGWKVLIDEDRLLSRIETLESQLQDFSKSISEDKISEELAKYQDEKDKYESTAKESLKNVLQEKLEAVQRAQELESSLAGTELECNHLRDVYENTQQELLLLAAKNDEHLKEIEELGKSLKETEEKEEKLSNKAMEEKQALENKLEEMKMQEKLLAAQIESLQANNDFAKEQLMAMKVRYEKLKSDDGYLKTDETNGIPTQGTLMNTSGEVEKVKEFVNTNKYHYSQKKLFTSGHLEKSENDLVESRNKIQELTSKLDEVEDEKLKSEYEIEKLKGEVIFLRERLETTKKERTSDESLAFICSNDDEENDTSFECYKLQLEMKKMQEELECLQNFTARTELSQLQQLMEEAQQETKDRENQVTQLKMELARTEEQLQDARQQVIILKDKISNLEQDSMRKQEEVSSLRVLIDEERKVQQKLTTTVEQTKKHLQDTQQNAKQSQNETDHLKRKLKTMLEELWSTETSTVDSNKHSAELYAMKEECSSLRSRIQSLETEIQKYKSGYDKLTFDYKKLEESYSRLEAYKVVLENKGDSYWKEELVKIKCSLEGVQKKLDEAQEEILLLNNCYAECNKEKSQLQRDLTNVKDDLLCMSSHSKTVALCSIIFAMLLAFLLTFCPSILHITGTSDTTNQT
ncbi:uncharacterized protein LOC143250548 isoform X2 [Tachypleus tridentatus]|uniref:uncharacterized protein LOC143250548 isoform X2 n=1 Tax=Tachypleus tridentatus TaxID=6853 RepID=UPI003FCFD6D6